MAVESLTMSQALPVTLPMAAQSAQASSAARPERDAQVQAPRANETTQPVSRPESAPPANPSARVSISPEARALSASDQAGNTPRNPGVSAAAQEQQMRADSSRSVAQAINSYATTSSLY